MPPEYTKTGRGFKHWDAIPSTYGHVLKVYESSAAEAPHLWLAINGDDSVVTDQSGEISAHLTIEQAEALIATLRAAIDNHYQGPDPSLKDAA